MTAAPVNLTLGPPARGSAVQKVQVAQRLPWLVTVFVLSLLLPTETSFMIGPLRLSPYRVVLLVAFVPLAVNLFSYRYGRLRVADLLILGYGLWAMLALNIHHGLGVALESGGILIVESFGAYLIARACIRTPEQFRSFARLVVCIVLIVGALTLVESLTGKHLIKKAFSALRGQSFSSNIDPRYGFHRAFGPFDHPILWGCFSASAVGLAWYAAGQSVESPGRKLRRIGLVAVAAATSVSGGAMAAMWAQFLMIGWDQMTRKWPHRWKLLIVCIVAGYCVVDLLSNRSGMRVLLSYLTFSPATAYGRLIIWEWGFHRNALEHPWFGIGMNEWVRPSWMHSTSMDNFWLVQMVTYGLPAFGLLAGAVIAAGRSLRPRMSTDPAPELRLAWMTTIVGACVAACTVHYWNQAFVWFCFLVGAASGSALTHPNRLHRFSK